MIKVYGYPVEVRLVIDIYGLTVNSRFRSQARDSCQGVERYLLS